MEWMSFTGIRRNLSPYALMVPRLSSMTSSLRGVRLAFLLFFLDKETIGSAILWSC
jgi:hypothetical protein